MDETAVSSNPGRKVPCPQSQSELNEGGGSGEEDIESAWGQEPESESLCTCTHCGYETGRMSNLRRHIKSMHEVRKVEDLICCEKRFEDKSEYREHCRQVHQNGHQCQICSRLFSRRALLRRHLSVHTGYKEFHCSLCSYGTSHKSNLERHLRTHQGHGAGQRTPRGGGGGERRRSSPSSCSTKKPRRTRPSKIRKSSETLSTTPDSTTSHLGLLGPGSTNPNPNRYSILRNMLVSPTPISRSTTRVSTCLPEQLVPSFSGGFPSFGCPHQSQSQVQSPPKEPKPKLSHSIESILSKENKGEVKNKNKGILGYLETGSRSLSFLREDNGPEPADPGTWKLHEEIKPSLSVSTSHIQRPREEVEKIWNNYYFYLNHGIPNFLGTSFQSYLRMNGPSHQMEDPRFDFFSQSSSYNNTPNLFLPYHHLGFHPPFYL